MKFKNTEESMKVRVKTNADSLTKASSHCRYQDDLGVRSAQGKTGVIERCDSSDKTLKVRLDGENDSNWFDPIHLELVPEVITLESLEADAVINTLKAEKFALKAKIAQEAVADFALKTKVYSFKELSSGAPEGVYHCTDLAYESKFIVARGDVFQISARGTYVSIANLLWSNDTFVKIDASYQITFEELV